MLALIQMWHMQGQGLCKASEAVTVVVMEFCDLQSLHRAIMKKVFKPHGRFTRQATYVSSIPTTFACVSVFLGTESNGAG